MFWPRLVVSTHGNKLIVAQQSNEPIQPELAFSHFSLFSIDAQREREEFSVQAIVTTDSPVTRDYYQLLIFRPANAANGAIFPLY